MRIHFLSRSRRFGLLSSRNLAIMATRRNDFPSLYNDQPKNGSFFEYPHMPNRSSAKYLPVQIPEAHGQSLSVSAHRIHCFLRTLSTWTH